MVIGDFTLILKVLAQVTNARVLVLLNINLPRCAWVRERKHERVIHDISYCLLLLFNSVVNLKPRVSIIILQLIKYELVS